MDQQALSPSGVWALVLASAVLMGSPGPSTMSVVAVGAAFGFRRSLGHVAGLVLGTTAVLLAVATGIVAALLSIPGLAPALTAASVAYMLFLAVQIARAPPPLPQRGSAVPPPSLSGGVLLAVANPKAYAAIAAVFGGTTLNGSPPATEALLKTVILGTMIVVIHAGWLLAGASLSRVLQDPVVSRIANLAFAAMLVAAGVFAVLR